MRRFSKRVFDIIVRGLLKVTPDEQLTFYVAGSLGMALAIGAALSATIADAYGAGGA